ncbi:MAG TPA: 2'-5' RNA ligase family protein [Acetobacteraceae bacterium]|jgi:2'-5' RNA ligase
MPYAITLRLDAVSAGRVRALWDALSAAGFTNGAAALGYAPHLTLAILPDSVDAADLIASVRRATTVWRALPLHLAALAVFAGEPATLWLSPKVDEPLLRHHAALCAALPPLHHHYRPETWMPHVTLADDLAASAAGAAIDVAANHFDPFAATLDAIDVLRFRPIDLLWQARLDT